MAWRFASLQPDSASPGHESCAPWRLFLTGLWFWCSPQPDSGPQYSVTPVLSRAWLSCSLGPDIHSQRAVILVLSRHWFFYSLGSDPGPLYGLTVILSTSWVWSSLHPESGPFYGLILASQGSDILLHLAWPFSTVHYSLTHYGLNLCLIGIWLWSLNSESSNSELWQWTSLWREPDPH